MTDNWTAVSDGSVEQEVKIVFEEIGDEFTGEYLGLRELKDRDTGNVYFQARFRDPETSEIVFCRANWSLKEGLEKVRIGGTCKVIYSDDVDTGRESPMRAFTVMIPQGQAPATSGSPNSSSARPVRRATGAKRPAKPSEAAKS